MNWILYDKGSTIESIGSESGKIITDIEHIGGARITIEKDGDIAPYTLTLGIYGLMFHTYFTSTLTKANKYMEFAKYKIQEIIFHYEIPEELRDNRWRDQLDDLLKELTEYP